MSSDREYQFPAIWLLTGVGERYKLVDTVIRAADILTNEWPPNGGKAYMIALRTCLNALQNRGPVGAVPSALIRAADEAFICYMHVVRGGERREPANAQLVRTARIQTTK